MSVFITEPLRRWYGRNIPKSERVKGARATWLASRQVIQAELAEKFQRDQEALRVRTGQVVCDCPQCCFERALARQLEMARDMALERMARHAPPVGSA